jgi:hypothetical protein
LGLRGAAQARECVRINRSGHPYFLCSRCTREAAKSNHRKRTNAP